MTRYSGWTPDAHQMEIIKTAPPPGCTMLICAGPGSGKTSTMMQHAQEHAPNEGECLKLMFTRAAAEEIRLRVGGRGDVPAENIARSVTTLHGFARGVLAAVNKRCPDILPRDNPLFGHSRNQAVRDLGDLLKSPRGAVEAITECVHEIYGPNMRILYVDEAQDLNVAQARLVRALQRFVWPHSTLFVVGDPRQAIFGFQGGRPELMMQGLGATTRGSCRFALSNNYRSSHAIVAASNAILSAASGTGGGAWDPCTWGRGAHQGEGQKPVVRAFSNPGAELAWVANEIRSLVRGGATLDDVAILARTRRNCLAAVEGLVTQGIDCVFCSSGAPSEAGGGRNGESDDGDGREHFQVTIKTVHGAKGSEADHVFVIGAFDGAGGFPSAYVKNEDDEDEDEDEDEEYEGQSEEVSDASERSCDDVPTSSRGGPKVKVGEELRLAYTAFTRPRKTLSVTYSSCGVRLSPTEAAAVAQGGKGGARTPLTRFLGPSIVGEEKDDLPFVAGVSHARGGPVGAVDVTFYGGACEDLPEIRGSRTREVSVGDLVLRGGAGERFVDEAYTNPDLRAAVRAERSSYRLLIGDDSLCSPSSLFWYHGLYNLRLAYLRNVSAAHLAEKMEMKLALPTVYHSLLVLPPVPRRHLEWIDTLSTEGHDLVRRILMESVADDDVADDDDAKKNTGWWWGEWVQLSDCARAPLCGVGNLVEGYVTAARVIRTTPQGARIPWRTLVETLSPHAPHARRLWRPWVWGWDTPPHRASSPSGGQRGGVSGECVQSMRRDYIALVMGDVDDAPNSPELARVSCCHGVAEGDVTLLVRMQAVGVNREREFGFFDAARMVDETAKEREQVCMQMNVMLECLADEDVDMRSLKLFPDLDLVDVGGGRHRRINSDPFLLACRTSGAPLVIDCPTRPSDAEAMDVVMASFDDGLGDLGDLGDGEEAAGGPAADDIEDLEDVAPLYFLAACAHHRQNMKIGEKDDETERPEKRRRREGEGGLIGRISLTTARLTLVSPPPAATWAPVVLAALSPS